MKIHSKKTRPIGAIALGIALAMPAAASAREFYALGDSLTDNGRVVRLTGILPNATSTIFRNGRSSNGPVWAEYLPDLIGARFSPDDDYAINGALSGHGGYLNIIAARPTWRTLPGFVDQVDQLIAAHPRLRSDDVVGIWIGTNDQDLTKASLNGIEPFLGVPRPTSIAQMSAYTLSNVNAQLQRLIGIGGRQFVILNLNDANGSRPGYVDYNNKLPADLVQFSRQGVNVHLFDVSSLLNQMRRNPSAYGLNDAPDVQCRNVPSCSGGSVDLQNTYLTADGTHMMTSVHQYMARYIANQLNAPTAIATAPALGLDVARASALSALSSADGGPPGPRRVALSDKLSLFADVGYTRNFHGAETGIDAFDSDVELFSIGAEYRLSAESRAGTLFSSGNANGSIAGGQGRIGIHAYRLGLYHAFDRAGLFVRSYVGAGWNQYRLNRSAALAGSISATTNGFDFGGLVKAGYLFSLGGARLGPVADVGYTQLVARGYAEDGDPILVQNVGVQRLKGVSAGAGVRFAAPLATIGLRFGELSAEAHLRHDAFNNRTLVTAQRYAPDLPISTAVDGGSATYERLSVALTVDPAKSWRAKLAMQVDIGNARRRSYNLLAMLGGTF
ncbi:autotransporter outer membrane beta-barrel domain-containing protein [Burkholderia sp. ABCPW 14]|uniref:autotransporter domain-containing protein n=1 Tax=Burkholderia sp. ABCPW 14 TaxID=1637860 RepID=UPI000770E232|nr:autotransporter domain-containing protein [Burkholderia sp. ABCPW 14]KVD90457.1 autotransporter outer membrane beta-barrel domain-containing protein [Burkholderia sp. ABCPW 14]